ncbi:hypothetical protein BV25DRAFT_1825991 [Artomyces pyxidatus]|uniref:Uncharacterized protein n=1 Tax=Artomyces pyxidatus TaxID=48021 RepID=A0ACB8T164_9AGAM|nr:hypothetical protein BV25DRAFT_1825991 [Artomyces pyxidatus]
MGCDPLEDPFWQLVHSLNPFAPPTPAPSGWLDASQPLALPQPRGVSTPSTSQMQPGATHAPPPYSPSPNTPDAARHPHVPTTTGQTPPIAKPPSIPTTAVGTRGRVRRPPPIPSCCASHGDPRIHVGSRVTDQHPINSQGMLSPDCGPASVAKYLPSCLQLNGARSSGR